MVLVGLAILFIYASELDLKAVERIETLPNSEPVKITGTVTSLSNQDGTLFLEVEGNRIEKTQVIVFVEENLFLEEGDYVEVSGRLEEYNGEKEVVASKVVKK